MIRTLIAEDELPLLRGIRQLVEQIDPEFSVVCCVKNGKEAMEYITQHSVDVLFTDINMPVFTGLELMEQARQLAPQLEMVVISGYNDFEYARQAMRYGACRYLLKPIDKEELARLLASLKSTLNQRSYTQKREALIECLFGVDTGFMQKCQWGRLRVLHLCAGSFQTAQTSDELPAPGALSDESMRALVKQATGCGEAWLFFGPHPNEAIWVLEDCPPLALPALTACVRQKLGRELPVTVAAMADPAPGELHTQTGELAAWLRAGAVFGAGRLIQQPPPASGFKLTVADKTALQIAAQKRQYDEFALILHKLKGQLRGLQVTQQELEHFLVTVLELLCAELSAESLREPRAIAQELVSGNEEYDSLFKALLTYCADLFGGRAFDTGDKDALMQAMDEYIVANITASLSLGELSTRFGLVAPYLSKLFKAYKGMSPAQYVQNIRIESAKRMLKENPTMLSKDIAEALGYSNALYFSKTFYKNVGMYPSDYRAHCKREN